MLFADDCRYARNGWPVSAILQRQCSAAAMSGLDASIVPVSARTYLPNGRPPNVGEIFRKPGLANTYEAIAQGGRDAYYRGSIARKIVAFSEANGGYFTMPDFEDHTSEWVEPVTTSYRGYDVWELPPNSQGIIALMMLNMLEGYDIASMGHNTADGAAIAMVEALQIGLRRSTSMFVADPAPDSVPVAELISRSYGKRRVRAIDRPHRARARPRPRPIRYEQLRDRLSHESVDKRPERNPVVPKVSMAISGPE